MLLRIGSLALFAATLGGCSGDDAGNVPSPNVGTPIAVHVTCMPLEVDSAAQSQCMASIEGTSASPQWEASNGTIDPTTGLFRAPDTAGTVTITATVRDQGQIGSGSADITVRQRPPITVSVACTPLEVYTLDASQCTVTVEGSSVPPDWGATGGTVSATGLFTAPDTPGTVTVVAEVLDGDRLVSGSIEITVRQRPPITVSVACTPLEVYTRDASQCTATVEGTGAAPEWDASSGMIDSTTGLFSAPDTPGTVTITATVRDHGRIASGSAEITVRQPPVPPIAVHVTCAPLQVSILEASQCMATVEGTGAAPEWEASSGMIDPATGLFTAPDALGTITITATVRDEDRTASGSVVISVWERSPLTVLLDCRPWVMYTSGTSQCTASFEGSGTEPRWSASSGMIDAATGVFVAPDSPGRVAITAAFTDNMNRLASGVVELAVVSREQPRPEQRLRVTVTCTPRLGLHPSDTVHCTASVEGTDLPPRWRVTAGSFDPATGVFTLPDSPGTVRIIAVAQDHPTRATSHGDRLHVWPRDPVRQRVFTDLADDEEGYQVHVMYVLASDAADREFDINGAIDWSVESWGDWLAAQTAGRRLRLDRVEGALDVTFVRLDRTDSELREASSGSPNLSAVQTELITKGFGEPNKIYLAYYDSGILPAASLGGQVCGQAASAVGALFTRECGFPYFLDSLDVPDFVSIHELIHVLGFVPACAPHQGDGSHVTDAASDLMAPVIYGFFDEVVLDVNRDDYFEAGIAECRDLADSAFLDPLPASAEVPSWLEFEILESIACSREGSLRSTPEDEAGHIEVFNGTGAPINLYSLDTSGTRVFENSVQPFDMKGHATGGVLVVTDETNQCLGIYSAPMSGEVGRAIVN